MTSKWYNGVRGITPKCKTCGHGKGAHPTDKELEIYPKGYVCEKFTPEEDDLPYKTYTDPKLKENRKGCGKQYLTTVAGGNPFYLICGGGLHGDNGDLCPLCSTEKGCGKCKNIDWVRSTLYLKPFISNQSPQVSQSCIGKISTEGNSSGDKPVQADSS